MTTATVADTARPPPVAGAVRPANRLAEQITGRTYLSHSQISLMRACPMRFSKQYVEHAPKDFVPSALLLGGGIHTAVETWFRARLEGLSLAPEALLSAYHDHWDHELRDCGVPVRFNKTETVDTVHALAHRMIAAFLASPLAQPKGTIVGIEEPLWITLDDELPDVLAVVDLVTINEGFMHIVDFKTSRSRWTPQKAQEAADQLVLYGQTVASASQSAGVDVKLHFAILTKHKTPLVQILPVAGDAHRVAAMKESITAVWEAIKAGHFYPAPSPMNCATCPFHSRCPVFKGC